MENQVPYGAGTVNAKMYFEGLLWEKGRVALKHYHSDSGIFTADMFKESCADGEQSQTLVVWALNIKMLRLKLLFTPSCTWLAPL